MSSFIENSPFFFVEVMGQRSFSSTIYMMMMIQSYRYFYPGPYTFSPINQNIHHHSFNIIFLPLGLVFFLTLPSSSSSIHRPTDRTNEWLVFSLDQSFGVYCVDECPCCSVVDGGIDDCVIGAYYNPNYFIHSVKRERERKTLVKMSPMVDLNINVFCALGTQITNQHLDKRSTELNILDIYNAKKIPVYNK